MKKIAAKDITVSVIFTNGRSDLTEGGPVVPYRISERKDGAKILFYGLETIIKSKRTETSVLRWICKLQSMEIVEVYIDASVYSSEKKPESQYLMHQTVLRILRECVATLCISVCTT